MDAVINRSFAVVTPIPVTHELVLRHNFVKDPLLGKQLLEPQVFFLEVLALIEKSEHFTLRCWNMPSFLQFFKHPVVNPKLAVAHFDFLGLVLIIGLTEVDHELFV